MKTIWKYALSSDITLCIPKGAEILTVAIQRDVICLWAKVDLNAATEQRRFMTFSTGDPHIPEIPMKYVGTSQLQDGSLVFHTFEILKEEA